MDAKKRSGVTLVELMIAISIMALVILAVVRTMLNIHGGSLNSRMQIRASRLADMIQTRYTNMFYGYVLPVDSRRPNFGLPQATYPIYSTQTIGGVDLATAWTDVQNNPAVLPQTGTYPEITVLREIHDRVRQAGFAHFSVGVTPMRRDLTATTGMTSALVPYLDVAPADGVDDTDPAIGTQDLNGDGDTVDFFWWSGRGGFYTSEQPNTHISELRISLYKADGTEVSKRGQLLSMEGMGRGGNLSTMSDESVYGILLANMLSTTTVTLFDRNSPDTAIRAAENQSQDYPGVQGFPIQYPADMIALQADSVVPLRLQGWTEPGATVEIRANPDAADAILDGGTSDIYGNFDINAVRLTGALVLGWNQFALRSVKGHDISPFLFRRVIKDDRPPQFSNPHPPDNNTIRTLAPFVQVDFKDPAPPSTTVVSGICPGSIRFLTKRVLERNYVQVPSLYDAANGGRVLWADPATGLPAVHPDQTTFNWIVEGGDWAGYKTVFPPTREYTFRVTLLADSSPPQVILNPVVAGSILTVNAQLLDGESGVDLRTFQLSWGPDPGPLTVAVNRALSGSNFGSYFQRHPTSLEGAVFQYTVPTPLVSGQYRVEISVTNFKLITAVQSAVVTAP